MPLPCCNATQHCGNFCTGRDFLSCYKPATAHCSESRAPNHPPTATCSRLTLGAAGSKELFALLQDCKVHSGPLTYFMPCTSRLWFAVLAQAGWIFTLLSFFTVWFNINRISHCTLRWESILPSLLEWRRKAKKTRSSCSHLPVRLD